MIVELGLAEALEARVQAVRDQVRAPVPPLPTVEYRLSPAGVLVKRDVRREPGWPSPHWTVVDKPDGDRSHWVGQHLPDQAVAGWSVLVRREQAVRSCRC